MTFPLFHRPGTIVFLDDDPDYLEMLAMVLPRHWHVKLFLRPTDCIERLQKEPPFWEADAWGQQQIIDRWRSGTALIPQVLEYWSTASERFALSRVCVVDFSMPGMDGLEVLSELADWPGARVLLTGQADEQVAVRAFNKGLIEQFIPKQTPDISRRLVESVEHLLATPHPRHAQTWRATLTPEQNALLRQPAVARELAAIAARRWVEHVAIGSPFGVLGMDGAGAVSWLQLETPSGVGALAELAEMDGVPAGVVADVRAGRMLVDVELRTSLGESRACEAVPAFRIGEEGTLLGAVFPVQSPLVPDAANSYNGWQARQEKRRVHD